MNIRIIQNQVLRNKVDEPPLHIPLSSYDIELPFEISDLRGEWIGIQYDIQRLFLELRDILSDAAINFRGRR